MKVIIELNKEQQGLKLIQVNSEFVVVDLKASIEVNDYFYPLGLCYPKKCVKKDKNNISEWVEDYLGNHDQLKFAYKIIFATPNLKLEGVPVIERKDDTDLIKQLQSNWVSKFNPLKDQFAAGILTGYKLAQQNLFTEEQIKEAIKYGIFEAEHKTDSEIDNFIEFLKQPRVKVTFHDNKPIKAVMI